MLAERDPLCDPREQSVSSSVWAWTLACAVLLRGPSRHKKSAERINVGDGRHGLHLHSLKHSWAAKGTGIFAMKYLKKAEDYKLAWKEEK